MTWRPGGPIRSGSGGGGRRRAAVFSFWTSLGRGPAMCEVVWVGVRGGKTFAWVFGGQGGLAWVFWGVPLGVGLPAVGVCGLPGVGPGEGCPAGGSVAGVCCFVGGWGRPVSRGPGVRAMVGVCGLPGGLRGGRGMGWDRAGGVCCVGVCVGSQRRACVVSCRPGGMEEKLAVFCGRGKDFADELAYLVHPLVSGGKRVC